MPMITRNSMKDTAKVKLYRKNWKMDALPPKKLKSHFTSRGIPVKKKSVLIIGTENIPAILCE